MTDDEILEEVDKAFWTCESLPVSQLDNKYFIAFARAIAAREREACARVCEKLAWGIEVTDAFAAAIRARSET